MRCVSEIWLPDQKRFVPCGRCNFCLQRNRLGWSVRLFEEQKVSTSSVFLTLTYDPAHEIFDIPSRSSGFEKSHLQDFWKRVRYEETKKGKERKPVKYYAVAEHGGQFGRAHYHSITFNLHLDTLGKLCDLWGHGFVHIGKVEPASVNYVTGYVVNNQEEGTGKPFPFSLMSKGLGKSYLTEQIRDWHNPSRGVYRGYYEYNGVASPLPRYYRDKLFTQSQKLIMSAEVEKIHDDDLQREINRIREFHPDPYAYYDRLVQQKYDRVRNSKHKSNR